MITYRYLYISSVSRDECLNLSYKVQRNYVKIIIRFKNVLKFLCFAGCVVINSKYVFFAGTAIIVLKQIYTFHGFV